MRKTTIAALALTACTAIACGSGATDTQGPGSQGAKAAEPAKGKAKKIVLEVTGPKTADITYGLGTDTSQENGAKVPWKKELSSVESLLIVTVMAQSKGTSGDIGCKVTVDGKVVKENKSSGQYAVVTCTANNIGG